MNKKYALFLLVYKNRKQNFISNLDKIDSSLDIYIVAQLNDPNIDEYEQYITKDNIKILQPDVSGVVLKREYILNYGYEHSYEGIFLVDDDIKFDGFQHILEENKTYLKSGAVKYRPSKVDVNDVIHKMIKTASDTNSGIVTCGANGFIGFHTPGQVYTNKTIYPFQFIYLNPTILHNKSVSYLCDETIAFTLPEDVYLAITAMQHGVNCSSCTDTCFSVIASKDEDRVTFGCYDTFVVNLYVKYHIPFKLCISGKHTGEFKQVIRYSKFFNNFELPPITDTYLYELAKEQKHDEIKQHLLKIGQTHGKTNK